MGEERDRGEEMGRRETGVRRWGRRETGGEVSRGRRETGER
jgi:hypothetical protein